MTRSRQGKQLRKSAVLVQSGGEVSAAGRKARARADARIRKLVEPWHADLKTLWEEESGERARLSSLGMVLLAAWADLGSAASIQSVIAKSYPALLAATRAASDGDRRDFLHSLAHRAPGAPTHLDVLLRVVEWDAVLVADRAKGSEQLAAITADLVLLFTGPTHPAAEDYSKIMRKHLGAARGSAK